MTEISTVAGRRKLRPRKEPYWGKLARGVFLGYSTQHSSWHLRVRGPDGRQTYRPLGGFEPHPPGEWFDLAKTAAEKHTGPLKQGVRNDYTIADAIRDYLAKKRTRVSEGRGEAAAGAAVNDAESKLAHVSEQDRGLKLSSLTVTWLENWQQQLHQRETDRLRPQSARRVRAVLVAVLNEAWRTGKAADAPWRRAETIKGKTGRRDYFPKQKEVAALLRAADPHIRHWLDLQRLTGCRPGEASGFTCGDYHRGNATISVRVGKTGSRVVYLNDAGVKLLNRLTKGRADEDPLCRQANGLPWLKGAEQRPFQIARAAAKLPPKFVCYSLRHYFISQALHAGVPMLAIAQNCGTSLLMIQEHYGKFAPTTHREMLNKVKL
jgi:integrase